MKKCQHEWRTLQGWKTECDKCGLSIAGALYFAEKQVAELSSTIESQKETNLALCVRVAELTARAEIAEASLNKIFTVAKKRSTLIAEVQQRSKDYENYQTSQMGVDLYDLKNADKELHNVIYNLLAKDVAGGAKIK